jgi:hypothetical protein
MKNIPIIFSLVVFLIYACGSEEKTGVAITSKNQLAKYFYPVDTIPKIYLYRDVANGLDEKFHRIYAINDSKGQHVVVEIYTATGRLIEAYNYNVDSLDLMDHMVVDRNGEKKQTELFENRLFPTKANDEVTFASRFPGFLDSTVILTEINRKTNGIEIKHNVLGKDVPSIIMTDKVQSTQFKLINGGKKDAQLIPSEPLETDAINYFAEGYGLVEFHSKNKKAHYKLERIFSQEEWLKIITR